MPAIDLSQVKGIEPVPAGQYPATITSAVEGTSQAGNQKIDIQWKLETGEKGTDGRIVFDTLTFTVESLFRVKNTLIGLGYDKTWSGEVTPEMLIGQSGLLTVDIQVSTKVDPETGEAYPPRNRVKKVTPLNKTKPARAERPAVARR